MNSYKPQKEIKTISESIKKELNLLLKKIYWFNYTKLGYLKKTYFLSALPEKIPKIYSNLKKNIKLKKLIQIGRKE